MVSPSVLKTSSLDLGFETIGNATLICYDKVPILATDPWIQGSAYFGSWSLSHEIPTPQRNSILACPYLWLSHGHPDHLNPESMPLFKGKKILLADHVGKRIYNDLSQDGFDVTILPDRKWVSLSERIKVLSIADLGQDSILLVDINGRLVVNINDCGKNGWVEFVKKEIRRYRNSFMLALSGYGDTDMINFYDEQGRFIIPEAAKRDQIGPRLAEAAEMLGTTHVVPFSSMHRYQRSDSVWANAFAANLDEHGLGFNSARAKLLPPYVSFNCASDSYSSLNPSPNPDVTLNPSIFGDNWSDPLEKGELEMATAYFKGPEKLADTLGFINLRVGGKDNLIPLGGSAKLGVTFEAPRQSLMTAIRYEIFDDMLIGNFMKTTLHGVWPASQLHHNLTPYLCKYSDNGRAKTKEQLSAYFREYEKRSGEVRSFRRRQKAREIFVEIVGRNSAIFKLAKAVYHFQRRLALAR